MNKIEKEIAKASLKAEDQTLKELQQIYKKARLDVQQKIAELNARTDMQNIQSIVYQKKYQQAILDQINEALADLRTGQYKTIEGYLTDSYDNGYIGMMYSLQSQGIPITMPIDERKVVRALTTDSKLVSRYYKANPLKGRLEEDVDLLKTRIRTNLSRGIVAGKSWLDVAVDLAVGMNNPFDKAMHDAMRIVRTEGHRVNQQGFLDAGDIAKKKGADIVKQWDATMDSRTRPAHQQADGQIVEWDDFFSVGGEKMKAPSVGGSARNVCNCRCQLLQRAKWALDEDELNTLQERAEFFGLDKADSFEEYKQKYLKLPEKADTMKVEPEQKYFHDVSSTTTHLKKAMSDEDYQEYMNLIQMNPDIAPLYDMGDYVRNVSRVKNGGQFYGSTVEFDYPLESYIKDGMSKYHTIAHEYGHFFDTRKYDGLTFSEYQAIGKAIKRRTVIGEASSSDQFLLAMRKDAKNIKENFSEVVSYCRSHKNTTVGIQDAVDGLGYGRIWWGHGDKYYNRFYNGHIKSTWDDYSKEVKKVYIDLGFDASNQAKVKQISRHYETASELWANITSAVTTGGDELEGLKKYFPEATEAFLQIIKKVVK